MSEDLKPCPFTHGEPDSFDEGLQVAMEIKAPRYCQVRCDCGALGPKAPFKEADGESILRARAAAVELWNTRAETPQSIPSEREEIVTYLKACTPSPEFHDSDFSQGVIRGFEICIAQIEEGHHLSTRQALEQGSAE